MPILTVSDVVYFSEPAEFRAWLEKNHAKAKELWVGFYKKGTGKPSITWPQSVDQALCFGWIDGIRKSIDDVSYTIRFTPRNPKSIWSAVNCKRVEELTKLGLMKPAGLTLFENRDLKKAQLYSFENRAASLPDSYAQLFKSNDLAWSFFEAQPPSYKRTAIWWVVSAKQEPTRLKRLNTLIHDSEVGQWIAPLRRPGK